MSLHRKNASEITAAWILALSVAALSQIVRTASVLGDPLGISSPTSVDTAIPDLGMDRFAKQRLVSNGTTFLEVWMTEHLLFSDDTPSYSGVSFRLLEAGEGEVTPLLDGTLEADEAYWMEAIAIGDDYYVFWRPYNEWTEAARIDGATGEVLAAEPVFFEGDPSVSVTGVAGIVPNDEGALFLWLGSSIKTAVFDPDSLTLQGDGPEEILSVPAGNYSRLLAASATDERLLVAHYLTEDIGYYQWSFEARADLFDLTDNTPISSLLVAQYQNFTSSDPWGGLEVINPKECMSIGSNAGRFGMLWQVEQAGAVFGTYSRWATYSIDADTGAVLEQSETNGALMSTTCDREMPLVADNYLALCAGPDPTDQTNTAVMAIPLDSASALPVTGVTTMTSESVFARSAPGAHSADDSVLVTWQRHGELTYAGGKIMGAFADQEGEISSAGEIPIVRRVNSQIKPAVSIRGEAGIAVWMDGRNSETGDFDIYGALIDENGIPLSGEAIPIEGGPGEQRHPDVASNGSTHLIVWETDPTETASVDGIWCGALDGATGEALGEGSIEVPTPYYGKKPMVVDTPEPGEYLITMGGVRQEEDYSWTDGVFGVRVRVDDSGPQALSENPFLIATTADAQNGDIVRAGDGYLSVIMERQSSKKGITAILTGLDPEDQDTERANLWTYAVLDGISVPRAAVLGDRAFIAWRASTRVEFASLDLETLDVSEVTTLDTCAASDAANPPNVATDGEGVLVFWSCPGADGRRPDLRAARIDGGGTVLDSDPIRLDEDGRGRMTSMASGDGYLIAAHVMDHPHVWRVVTRRIEVESYDPGSEPGDGGTDGGSEDPGSGEPEAGTEISPTPPIMSCGCRAVAPPYRTSVLSILMEIWPG